MIFFVVSKVILDPKYRLYKFCDFPKQDLGLTALISGQQLE
jgi:hypothetical protein